MSFDIKPKNVMIGIPDACSKCGGELKYTGLGEYICNDCGNLEYDDYGKVRAYLEKNPGASQGEVVKATGVPGNKIRALLKEERIEVSSNSSVFLHCEMCGADIVSGRLCRECSKKVSRNKDAEKKSNSGIRGYSVTNNNSSGEMRFLKK